MTTDAIYEERRSDWSHPVSVVATTQWLQRDQTLPLSAKGVACETEASIDAVSHYECRSSCSGCGLRVILLEPHPPDNPVS